MALTNWAGNIRFGATAVHHPTSIAELQRLVERRRPLRVLGTGHSFNRIADTSGELVSLASLPEVYTLHREPDEPSGAPSGVTIGGGARYGEVAARLAADGLALHNLASLPHISVAGAVATGTHGSGDRNGNLATAVRAVRLLTGSGELLELRRGDRDFPGAVVALGALGAVVGLTLDAEPLFSVRQRVFLGLGLDRLTERFDEVFASGYSVSAFTRWRGGIDQVWVKQRVARGSSPPAADAGDPAGELLRGLGARPAAGPCHPIAGVSPAHCTDQLGEPGPWHERLPHFRLDFTPSAGDELQSEYLLPRGRAAAALAALDRLGPRISPVLQVSEIRTVAADPLWLSPSFERDTVAFHFTWVKDADAVLPVVAEIEAALVPLGARPHWGKVFTLDLDGVRALYPRLADQAELGQRLDPGGVFQNEFTRRCLPV